MNGYPWLFVVALCCGLTGCATEHSRRPASAAAEPPAKDRVLHECRSAASAMRRAQFDEAKRLLDDALLTMGASLANDKSAKKARSLFSEESKKTFRGEPYERVMAYYYRGILYWMDGEPDNARACFRSAS